MMAIGVAQLQQEGRARLAVEDELRRLQGDFAVLQVATQPSPPARVPAPFAARGIDRRRALCLHEPTAA